MEDQEVGPRVVSGRYFFGSGESVGDEARFSGRVEDCKLPVSDSTELDMRR